MIIKFSFLMTHLTSATTEGDWVEVEKLCSKASLKNYKSFLYAVLKQQYYELISRQEHQKAFTFLTKRLKPLESQARNKWKNSFDCFPPPFGLCSKHIPLNSGIYFTCSLAKIYRMWILSGTELWRPGFSPQNMCF